MGTFSRGLPEENHGTQQFVQPLLGKRGEQLELLPVVGWLMRGAQAYSHEQLRSSKKLCRVLSGDHTDLPGQVALPAFLVNPIMPHAPFAVATNRTSPTLSCMVAQGLIYSASACFIVRKVYPPCGRPDKSGLPLWLAKYSPHQNRKEREWRWLKRDVRGHLARDLCTFVDKVVEGLARLGGEEQVTVDVVPQWLLDGHRKAPTGRKAGQPVGAKDTKPRKPYTKHANLPAPT